jgi:hypothetical protein
LELKKEERPHRISNRKITYKEISLENQFNRKC